MGQRLHSPRLAKQKISIQCLLNQCLKLSVKMRDGANICSNCIILQMLHSLPTISKKILGKRIGNNDGKGKKRTDIRESKQGVGGEAQYP